MGIRSRSSVREIRGGGGPVRFPRRLARRPTREFRRGDLFESPFEAPSNFPILFSYFNARPLFSVPGIPTCIPTPAPRPDNSMKSFRSSFSFSLFLFFFCIQRYSMTRDDRGDTSVKESFIRFSILPRGKNSSKGF